MFRNAHHGKPCGYCSRPMDRASYELQATRDHAVPKSRGGKGGKDLVICCITCNGIKGNMTPEEWLRFMAEHPRWWVLTKKQLRDIKRQMLGLPSRRVKLRHARIIKRDGMRVTAVIVPPALVYGEPK